MRPVTLLRSMAALVDASARAMRFFAVSFTALVTSHSAATASESDVSRASSAARRPNR